MPLSTSAHHDRLVVPLRAMAGITFTEAWRQKLWLVVALGGLLLMAAIPNLRAVDDSARLKLSVATVSGTIGFVSILLAVLIGAVYLRRDIETRTGFMLFAKPLGRWRYLLGRWLGIVMVSLVAMLALLTLGIGSTYVQLGSLPTPLSVTPNGLRWTMSNGEPQPTIAGRERIWLSGPPHLGHGEGIRWRVDGLSPTRTEPYVIMIKATVQGYTTDAPIDRAIVSIDGISQEADQPDLRLSLVDHSPYGHGEQLRTGEMVLRNRGRAQNDYQQDYLLVELPPALIAADGSAFGAVKPSRS